MADLTPDLLADLKLLRYIQSEIDEHKRQIKHLQEMGADAEERIQTVMGDDEEATYDGQPAAEWKHVEYTTLDQKLVQEKFPSVNEACQKQVAYRKFRVVPE